MNKLLKYLMICNIVLWSVVFTHFTTYHYESVDPELQGYVKDFYAVVEKYCQSNQYNSSHFYDIGFIKLPKSDSTIAYCQQRMNGYSIAVNTTLWKDYIEPEKRQLLYHELSHCVIYKEHVQDVHNYMNPIFYPLPYEVYFPQVIQNVKSQCPSQ